MASTSPRRRSRWLSQVASGLIPLLVLCPRGASGEGGGHPTYLEVLDVNLVNVEVFATDKQGQPVPGLTAKDFEVFEDGRKMKLTRALPRRAMSNRPVHRRL
jgi:hypothetical protein